MPILNPRDQEAVRKEFERIAGPVKLIVFSQELAAAELCQQNEALVREVAELSDQITVEVLQRNSLRILWATNLSRCKSHVEARKRKHPPAPREEPSP